MAIQDSIDALTASTTSLISAVNVQKAALDTSVNSASASATTATTQATAASTSATAAATSATAASTSATNAATSATAAAASDSDAIAHAAIATTEAGIATTAAAQATAAALGLPLYPILNAATASGGSNVLPQGITSGTVGGTAITGATPGTYALTASGGSFTGVTANLVVADATHASIVIVTPGRTTSASPTAPTWANPSGATLPSGTTLTPNIGGLIGNGTGQYYLTSDSTGQNLLYWQNTGTGVPVAVTGAGGAQVSYPLSGVIASVVASLSSTVLQTIARPVGPALVTGTGLGSGVYTAATPVNNTGTIASIDLFALATGTVSVYRFSLSGGTFTPITHQSVTISSTGSQNVVLNMPVNSGDYIGIVGAGIFTYVTGVPDCNWYPIATTGGTTASPLTNIIMQVRLNLTAQVQTVTAGSVAALAATVAANTTSVSGKLTDIAALAPAAPVNACLHRYGFTSTVPAGQGSTDIVNNNAATYVYDDAWYQATKEPNLLEVSSNAPSGANNYYPVGGYFISAADLAQIGVTPNDTTPPTISVMASMVLSGLTNLQAPVSATDNSHSKVWIILRYNGVGGSTSIGYPGGSDQQHIVFTPYGTGPNTSNYTDSRFSGIANSNVLSSTEFQVCRKGIPVPATINGQALTGVIICGIGYSTAAGLAKMHLGHCAVVAGPAITQTSVYANPADSTLSGIFSEINVNSTAIAANATALSLKTAYTPPLEPAVVTNAIRNRFPVTSAVPSPHGAQSGAVATNVWNAAHFAAFGEPNVLQLDQPANANAYRPMGGYFVSPSDLINAGIVPDDTTPPTISMMGGILNANQVNQTLASQQVWFVMRYAGSGGSRAFSYGATTDITFNKSNTGYQSAPAGDARFSGIIGTKFTDGDAVGYYRQNVPVPATFNGQALTGIFIMFFGSSPNNALASTIQAGRAAIISGATIDYTKAYLNSDDKPLASSSSGPALNIHTLTIANSDKIGFNGDSYTESLYSPLGKCWVQKVSAFTDWPCRNLGTSGDWWEALTYKLRSNYSYHGQPTQGAGFVHIVGMSESNEPSYNSLADALQNASAWVDVAKGLGIKPYLATEWIEAEGVGYTFALRQLSEQKNVGFVDVRQTARLFAATQHVGYYGNGHPGVRTNEMIAGPMDELVTSLGRPKNAMKIFTKRAGVTVSGVDNLLYSGEYARAQLFREINIGQMSLNPADGSTTSYDTLTGTYTTAGYFDDYMTLQNGGSLTFADYVLIEAILDVQQTNLTALTLQISDPGATVYVKNLVAAPYPSNTTYQGFVMASDPGITVGATYTSNEAHTTGQTYTYVGYAGGMAIFSPRFYTANGGGSGTLTKTGGSGPSTEAFTSCGTAFDLTYYAQKGLPVGHWVALTGINGLYTLTGSSLQGVLDFDKVSFLVYKSAAYTLGAPVVTYTADRFGKPDYFVQDYRKRATGAQLLTTNAFVTGFTGWTTEGSPAIVTTSDSTPLVDPPINPTTGVTMTSCAVVSPANKVRQSVVVTQTFDRDTEIEVRVWPRFYPVENDGSITQDSFDYEQVLIELINPDDTVLSSMTKRVGLWWRDVAARFVIPAVETHMDIRVSAVSGNMQLAWVSVKLV